MNEEIVRANLKKVFDEYRDYCVEKAILRLKQYPDRSDSPYLDFDKKFLYERLIEEIGEFLVDSNNSELEDIGNFSAWLHYHRRHFLS